MAKNLSAEGRDFMNKKQAFIMCFVTAAVVFFATTALYFTPPGMYVYSRIASVLGHEDSTKLFKIESIIDSHFYGEAPKRYMLDRALTAYTQSIGDKYTTYMNSTTFQSVKDDLEGEFHGIGVVVTAVESGIVIKEVQSGSPAERAGMQAGDFIVAVNGKEYLPKEFAEAVSAIRETGPGEKCTVTIRRDTEVFDVEVVPDDVDMEYVTHQMVDEEIGYIRIKTFGKKTAEDFDNALKSLEKSGMKSLIIDLRSNPGGSLDTVVKMVDRLVGEGIITTVKYKNEKNTEEYYSDKEEVNLPMCVLINEESASASEIMSACLKDYKKATLVGKKTYGKGVVQAIYDLGDSTALRLTVAKYYTPSGICIDGEGVEPDVEVDLPEDKVIGSFETDFENDTQFEKAVEILKN